MDHGSLDVEAQFLRQVQADDVHLEMLATLVKQLLRSGAGSHYVVRFYDSVGAVLYFRKNEK